MTSKRGLNMTNITPEQLLNASDIEAIISPNESFDSRQDPAKVRLPLQFSQRIFDKLPAGRRRDMGDQKAAYDAIRRMIASNQTDENNLTGTAHTQLGLLETSLVAYGNALRAYASASVLSDSKATSVASDNESKAARKVKRIEELAKSELAERRKLNPDSCPSDLLPVGYLADAASIFLAEGFEVCFFHVIHNHGEVSRPSKSQRKTVNVFKVPYMLRDAHDLLISQGV